MLDADQAFEGNKRLGAPWETSGVSPLRSRLGGCMYAFNFSGMLSGWRVVEDDSLNLGLFLTGINGIRSHDLIVPWYVRVCVR